MRTHQACNLYPKSNRAVIIGQAKFELTIGCQAGRWRWPATRRRCYRLQAPRRTHPRGSSQDLWQATKNVQEIRSRSRQIGAKREGENRRPFGSVPLSYFWSRRLAWLAVPTMARKQRSSTGSGLGFWRWEVVRRPSQHRILMYTIETKQSGLEADTNL